MRVCIFTLHPVDDRRVRARGADTLARAGAQVRLIGTAAKQAATERSSGGTHVEDVGQLGRSASGRLSCYWRLYKSVSRVDADVFHTHDPDLLPLLLWVKLRRRRPVIYDVHEFYSEQFSRRLPRRLQRIGSGLIDRVEKLLASGCRNVIVVDPAMVEAFSAVGCKVLLAPNHVLARAYQPSAARSTSEKIVVASTGTISEARGSLVLADVCRLLHERNAPVRFIIWERSFIDDELRRFNQRLGENLANVELREPVRPDELAVQLTTCHIGISTLQDTLQYAHSVPSKLFEFMSARLAIVASDLPATRRVLEPLPHAELVPHDEPAAYVAAIERLVNDRDLLESARNEARAACLTHYDWDTTLAPDYVAFFEDLVGRAAPGHRAT